MTRAKCGTESGYATHVNKRTPICDDCRDAHREYTRTYRQRNYQRRLTDAAPVRAHLEALVDAGATLTAVAQEIGVHYSTIKEITSGRRATVTTYTADRILAAGVAHGIKVPGAGTARRISALLALGWSGEQLGERLGVSSDRVRQYTEAPKVFRETAQRVRALYDELSMTPGPSRRARTWAEKAGRVVPLAWDDDTIDDPGAWANLGADEDDHIDTVVVDTLVDRFPYADWRALNATRAERLVALDRLDYRDQRNRLRALGWQDNQIDLPSVDAVLRYLGLRSTDAQWGAA